MDAWAMAQQVRRLFASADVPWLLLLELRFRVALNPFDAALGPSAMAPHLSPAELDFMLAKERLGKSPIDIHGLLKARRDRKGIVTPNLTAIRKALKGATHKRAHKETRGRKPKYTKKMVLKANKVRKELIKKAAHLREVRWQDIQKAARTPACHRGTLKRAFVREGISVAARTPREKPQRKPEHKQERFQWAEQMSSKTGPRHCPARPASIRRFSPLPPFAPGGCGMCVWGGGGHGCGGSYFTNTIDMIIDNKKFDVPTTERARRYLQGQKVRFHLRSACGAVVYI